MYGVIRWWFAGAVMFCVATSTLGGWLAGRLLQIPTTLPDSGATAGVPGAGRSGEPSGGDLVQLRRMIEEAVAPTGVFPPESSWDPSLLEPDPRDLEPLPAEPLPFEPLPPAGRTGEAPFEAPADRAVQPRRFPRLHRLVELLADVGLASKL